MCSLRRGVSVFDMQLAGWVVGLIKSNRDVGLFWHCLCRLSCFETHLLFNSLQVLFVSVFDNFLPSFYVLL